MGVPIALAPLPFARQAAYIAGTAASGYVAYQMASYQIMQEFLEFSNDDKFAQFGVGLTQFEEDKLKKEFHNAALRFGLWEAIPEALSNLAFFSILTGGLTNVITQVLTRAGISTAAIKTLTNTAVTRILGKMALLYGEELLTETITQKGQARIEFEAGLREEDIGWVDSFKEIAPQTFLLTTVMAGAGQVIISSKSAIDKAKKSLTEEIGTTHPQFESLTENIENNLDDAVRSEPVEGVPDVTPEAPAVPEVRVENAQILVNELKRLEQGETLSDIEMLRIKRISPQFEKDIGFAGREVAEREEVNTAIETLMTKTEFDTYRDFLFRGTEEGRLVANELARKVLTKNGWLFDVAGEQWYTPIDTGMREAMIDALRSDAEDLLDQVRGIAPTVEAPVVEEVTIPKVTIPDPEIATPATNIQETAQPEVINETVPVPVDDNVVVHDVSVIDRFRPSRFVFEKMGLTNIWQSAFEAETLLREEHTKFAKELNKHAKAVGKDAVRRELIWEFVNNSNQEAFNQLTFEEKQATNWWKRTADDWANRLNIPQERRIKNYIPHIFDEQARQMGDIPLDASIAMILSKKIADKVNAHCLSVFI